MNTILICLFLFFPLPSQMHIIEKNKQTYYSIEIHCLSYQVELFPLLKFTYTNINPTWRHRSSNKCFHQNLWRKQWWRKYLLWLGIITLGKYVLCSLERRIFARLCNEMVKKLCYKYTLYVVSSYTLMCHTVR